METLSLLPFLSMLPQISQAEMDGLKIIDSLLKDYDRRAIPSSNQGRNMIFNVSVNGL